MPNFTTNLNLEKPLGMEYYDIEVHNENSDKIDTFAGTVVKINDIVDNLTTASATKPLSANMGNYINDIKFDNKPNVILENTDMNSFMTLGHHTTGTNSAVIASIVNSPFSGAAFTFVVDSIGGNYFTQLATRYHDGAMKIRATVDGGVTWKPWVEIMTSSTPPVPIGGILAMADNTSPADKYPGTTWSIVVDDKYIRGGNQSTVNATGGSNTKTIAVENLPAFTVTRGTMDITGTIGVTWDVVEAEGAVYGSGVSSGEVSSTTTGADPIRYFQASRNWTGASSSVGSGTALNVENAYHKLVFWKRLT